MACKLLVFPVMQDRVPRPGIDAGGRRAGTAGILLWLYLIVLWLTWTPTGTSDSGTLLLSSASGWIVILGNLVLFGPLAVVLAAVRTAPAHAPGSESWRTILPVAAMVTLLSLLVEGGQFWIPGRSPSPYDVALNAGGAAAAALAAARLVQTGVRPATLIVGSGAVVFVGVVLFLSATGFAAGHGMHLDQWNHAYEVSAGDEPSGGRKYLGSVADAQLCAGGTGDEVCVGDGAAPDARRAISRTAANTQRVRLSAVVLSTGPQTGPARIVTFSNGQDTRNATLAQDAHDLVLRLRTPLAGPNGSNVEFVLPNAVRDGVSTRVAASFEPGRVRITSETEGNVARGDMPWGLLSGWWMMKGRSARAVEARPLLSATLVGAAALALPLGIGAARVARMISPVTILAGGLLPPILLILIASVFDIPIAMREILACIGFGMTGAGLSLPARTGGWPARSLRRSPNLLLVLALLTAGCHDPVAGEREDATTNPPPRSAPADRIRPYTANPYYWQYFGEPILLLGGSDQDNLFNHPDIPPDGLEAHLNLLKSVGGNYVRNNMSSRDEGNVWPFHTLASGTFDLGRWNPEYWERFDRFLRMTEEREIIVQIELWDRFDFAQENWDRNPFNPRNNINYTEAGSGLPGRITTPAPDRENPFFRTPPGQEDNQIVLPYQRALVEKILMISLPYPHVLYTISNETGESATWSAYWADVIHQQGAASGYEVQITEMWAAREPTDPLHDHTFDDPIRYSFVEISQNNHQRGQRHWDYAQLHRNRLADRPRPMNSVKIYGGPRHGGGVDEGTRKLWRNIFGGLASSRFHRPHDPEDPSGIGLNEVAQSHIRSLRMLTDELQMFGTRPRNDLLSNRSADEAYATAEEGKRYAVYFPAPGSVALDLRDVSGPLSLRWLDILSSKWVREIVVEGGQHIVLSPPGQGPWAALLTAR